MPYTFFRSCFLFLLITFNSGGYAASAHEQDQLSLILQQFDTLERLATQAEAASTAEPDDRYRFDYSRLIRDLQSIRSGVRGYVSPSRAQPRDPAELVGNYRIDTPSAESSP
ncbi:RAQPRD family integrative conjugative element protein [Pseudomonas sp. LG1E9]|uniref:integrative conjugative element protein, RAQPRD family n=1 Tax=Pseudomonas sp. LG1E9 TaxID=2219057 RepID=UPI000DD3FF32|nr:RAQPRD family integrative conjugative element protein [Pseudomonas sp. LG1E9]